MQMVSVCMATYNGEPFLREQIDSILSQLNEKDELVISDDNSKDSTVDIIKSYHDKRIKLFINKEKKGVTHNFENALVHSKGDLIFLADQDDVWLPGKIKELISFLKEGNYDVVTCNCALTDTYLNIIQNVKKFLPVMKYLASEGREFYFVTLTLQNCVTDDARVLRDFMRRCNRMWADGIRTKHKFRSLGISGVIKKECTYHVVKKDLFSFHYHFHIIVDSLEAAKYVVAQWKKLHGSTVADARFQKYKKIEDFENAAIEVFKYASKASVSKSKGRDGKKKIQINYKALDMIYTAMHGMQRMSSFGQFRTMIGDEALNDFRDEDLVLNIEGLNVEDGCYTWYMSVKDKVADWYNMETGEALCCYKVTRKDGLLQDIYLDEDIFPNSG